MLRPTFSGFMTASRGLSSSQRLLDITAQNITNMNTEGYTRQRLDLYSLSYSSGSSKYEQLFGGIGRGVDDNGASQIRDKFLDIRYRNESSKVGKQEILKEAYKDLSAIFDEVSKKGLDKQFSNFVSQLQALSKTPSDSVIEGVVKTAGTMVTQLLNKYANQIDTVRDQQIGYLKKDAMNDINNILKGISEYNDQIKRQNINGDKALELNDKRNLLIDKLSNYIDIEVSLNPTPIGNGRSVNLLSIVSKDLVDSSGNPLKLVSDNKACSLKVDDSNKRNVRVILDKDLDGSSSTLDLTDNFKKGKVSGYLDFLNNKAEYTNGTTFSTKNRGIQFYEGLLNSVANKFAKMMNDANKKPDGTDRPLFEAKSGAKITAANIQITDAWRNSNESYITNTKNKPVVAPDGTETDNKGANDNILAMIALFNKKFNFDSKDDGTGNFVFNGTIQEGFSNATSTLDLQINHTKDLYKSFGQTLVTIDKNRASISGVGIDEEGVNLLTYNKSYSAASRLMTTLDDALSTLINNTGRVGL